MKGPELALVLATAACAPTSGKIELDTVREAPGVPDQDTGEDTGTTPLEEGCSAAVSLSEYPNPLIQHADINPKTDVLNTVLITAANLGDTLCPEMELALSHDGTDYTQTLPEMESGEVIQMTQKDVILDQAGDAEFTVELDGVAVSTDTLSSREVGSVLKAQMAEYIVDHQELEVTECEGDASNEVPEYSSYCGVMQLAADQGWYTGSYPGGQEYNAINMAEFAVTLKRAYPELSVMEGMEWESPCTDTSSWDEWFKSSLEEVSFLFPEITELCDPEGPVFYHHISGTTYPSGGVLDQL